MSINNFFLMPNVSKVNDCFRLLLFLFFSSTLHGQAYKVQISTEPYDSLTQYISLSDNGASLYFVQSEFDLPWEFPFYEKKYKKISNEELSLVALADHVDGPFDMYLFNNVWIRYYQDDNSDYRYGQSSPDNVCFEWRKVGSWTTISDEPGDRGYATFKTCLWKNGDIELHFDKMEFNELLFDSIFTVPGLQGVVTSVALTNPDKRDEAIILSFDPNNPKIVNKWDFADKENPPFIKVLPKDKLKIKFVYNTSTSTNETDGQLFKIQSPISSVINIPQNFQFNEFRICTISGDFIHSGTNTAQIYVDNLPAGMYFLILSDGMVHNKYKFIKI